MNSTAPLAHPARDRMAFWFSGARMPDPQTHRHANAGYASPLPVPLPLDAELRYASGAGQCLALYLSASQVSADPHELTPLLRVHVVNAGASATEIRPLFARFAATRPVLALKLPGFGLSVREVLDHSPQAMSDAISRAVHYLRHAGGALFMRSIASLYQQWPQPVWIAHGLRGDFTGYDGLAHMPASDRRRVDVFGTGALPYFERPSLFASRYGAFLNAVTPRVAK